MTISHKRTSSAFVIEKLNLGRNVMKTWVEYARLQIDIDIMYDKTPRKYNKK